MPSNTATVIAVTLDGHVLARILTTHGEYEADCDTLAWLEPDGEYSYGPATECRYPTTANTRTYTNIAAFLAAVDAGEV